MFINGPVGYFGRTIIKALKAARKGYADVKRMSGNQIGNTNIQNICKQGTIPSLRIMRILADLFKLDYFQLQQFAARDYVDRIATYCQIKVSDIPGFSKESIAMPAAECDPHTIPIYDSDSLVRCLSRNGYPVRKSKAMLKSLDYGPHAYALLMKTQALYDRATVGDYAVIAPSRKIAQSDFGIAGYISGSAQTMKIVMGQLYIADSHVSVATLKPTFRTTYIDKKDFLFAYALASIILPDDSYIVRGL